MTIILPSDTSLRNVTVAQMPARQEQLITNYAGVACYQSVLFQWGKNGMYSLSFTTSSSYSPTGTLGITSRPIQLVNPTKQIKILSAPYGESVSLGQRFSVIARVQCLGADGTPIPSVTALAYPLDWSYTLDGNVESSDECKRVRGRERES